ncbi:MAG: DUF1573 domain-containing protein [Gemmataceae bacterium]
MARWGLAAIFLLAGPALAHAQNPDGWAYKMITDAEGKAVASHDFGTVPFGTQLHYTLKVKNIYAVPLNIVAGASCDCVTITNTKPVLGKEETGTLEINMDGRRFQGPKAVNVFVRVQNLPQWNSEATIKLTAFGRTDVTLNPGSINFGLVPPGQTPRQMIDIDYAGRQQDWAIVAKPVSDLFDITVVQRIREPSRVGYQIGLTLKPDAPPGTYKQEILMATNDAASPTVPIPVDVTVQPRLRVLPSPVKFPSTRAGGEATLTVLVQGPGNRKFKITGIEGLGDGLELAKPLPDQPQLFHHLTLKFASTQPGLVSRKITIKTDGDKDLTATVPVEANVVQ